MPRISAEQLTLYLATDPQLLGGRDIVETVADAIAGGVTVVQLRDKEADGGRLYEDACRLLRVTRPAGVPLIVNDRIDVMLASGADGVHVGASDLPLGKTRELAGDRIVGYSVNTPEDLRTAIDCGADYIGIGPAFPTSTKPDARATLGLDGLARLAGAAPMPSVAIGGISLGNCGSTMACGIAGICVISAILGTADVRATARAFRAALEQKATP
jgi:thiamine-phosphate pyrophosphorylase